MKAKLHFHLLSDSYMAKSFLCFISGYIFLTFERIITVNITFRFIVSHLDANNIIRIDLIQQQLT